MTGRLTQISFLALLGLNNAAVVTPVEKVIGLLEGMKSDIEKEATAEAVTYDKFACFCKDTTKTKSTSVTDGQDNIDKLSADIADNTATKNADETTLQGLKQNKEEKSADLEENTVRCAKEKAEYEGISADMNKALSSLKSALKSLADKKTAMDAVKASASLLEVNSGVNDMLALADAMGLSAAPHVKALLQQDATVDPADSDYKYKSSDIIDLLTSLQTDFKKEKESLDTEFGKTDAACTAIKASLAGKIETTTNEMKSTNTKISNLGTSIAEDRGKLVEAQGLMQDDEQYLKDLTERCETRAVQWDQRSSMRAGEVGAISTALKVLGDKVQGADTAVNSRVLLQQPEKAVVAETPKVAAPKKEAKVAVPEATKAVESKKTVMSFLQRSVVDSHSNQEAQEKLMKENAISSIVLEGRRLKSPVLTVLAMQIAADPFKKVKKLIQGLVERLITESAREATKKGFCDTELGKANRQRDFRWTNVKKLTAEVLVLQAKKDSLTQDVAALGKALGELDTALKAATKLRGEEKAENESTLNTARNGLKAVNEALLILRSFYKEAAKAASFLQASPVDEDTTGAGFSGSYQGKQDSSNAVLGLLETIASDFDRSIRSTESDEKSGAELFVKFMRASKVDIAGKSTKKELNEQDLKTTIQSLNEDKADLQNNMDLVDDAVKTLMDLKPTCVDTSMSYSDRVAKREEEVAALKKALCMLDPEKVEAECK